MTAHEKKREKSYMDPRGSKVAKVQNSFFPPQACDDLAFDLRLGKGFALTNESRPQLSSGTDCTSVLCQVPLGTCIFPQKKVLMQEQSDGASLILVLTESPCVIPVATLRGKGFALLLLFSASQPSLLQPRASITLWTVVHGVYAL